MAWRHYVDRHIAATEGTNQRRRQAKQLEDFCAELRSCKGRPVDAKKPTPDDEEEEEDDATFANYNDAHNDDHPDTTADDGDTADLEEEWAE
jgi:hypothetical protein